MKMTKKVLSILLSLMLVLGAVAVGGMTASAAETFVLRVGGVRVTDDNKDDVLGDGTVSYDPVSRTLTLNNANITTNDTAIDAVEDVESSNLTIILKGKNYLNGGRNALCTSSVDTVIDGSMGGTLKAESEICVAYAPLTIQNVSNLEVRGRVYCPLNPESNAPYSLKIKDSMVAVKSDDTEAIYTPFKPLIISGSSVVMAQASDSAMYFNGGLTLEDGLSLSSPEGGTFGFTRIRNPDGTNAKRAVIGNGYFIDPESNPTAGGTVSGGGLYNSGSTATVTATPNTGYHFVNWTENSEVVSTNAEYSFTVNNDRNLTANFELDTHSVSVTANPTEGGTVTGGGTYNYGGSATVTATPNQHYHFVNWTENGDEVSTDAEYTFTVSGDRELVANFEIQKFTVQFVNDDGTELQSGQVIYGGTPAYTGEMPTKEATAQYTYSFLAWTPAIVPVTDDATYKATYSSTVNEYSVEFVNEDGTELQSSPVAYGETPVYTGETPTKEQSDQYVYTFGGWSPEITNVTGEATYTATFTPTPVDYKITWQVDGESYKNETVPFGATVTEPDAPVKDYYTFIGWDKEIPATMPAEDLTFNAQFSAVKYPVWIGGVQITGDNRADVLEDGTVSFEVVDGKHILTLNNADITESYRYQGWDDGEYITANIFTSYPVNDTAFTIVLTGENKLSGAQYGIYDWNSALLTITGDGSLDVTAEYCAISGCSVLLDGIDLTATGTGDEENTGCGILAWYLTVRNSKVTVSGTGNGDAINCVSIDIIDSDVTALSEEDICVYCDTSFSVSGESTVIMEDCNGNQSAAVIGEFIFDDENDIIEPFNYALEEYGDCKSVYNADDNSAATKVVIGKGYAVTFIDDDGETVLYKTKVLEGATPEYKGETLAKTDPAGEYDYTFAGWSPEITSATGEATYTATYTSTPVDYTVTFCVDGEVYKESTVPFGTETSKPDDPIKDGYTFKWVDQIPETMPAQDVIINGEFTAIEYTATFVDENGETVEKVTFTVKDESITEPEVPAKEGYTGKWEEYKLTPGGITVKPVYTEIPSDEPSGEPADPVTVNGNRSSTLGYKENQTFTADTANLPEGAEVHWFVNGEDAGTGSEYTVVGPKDDYTVQAKVTDSDGNVLSESAEQSIKVRHGFLDKVMFFFAYLLKILLYPYFMLGIL